MQYKIPVQIENEDPIIGPLSLRQLIIIMVGGGIAYSLFNSLAPSIGVEIAAIPSIFIVLVALMIALFKHSEMTFIPFALSLTRFHTNYKERRWVKGVDSFQPIDIGYITNIEGKKEEIIDFKSKMDQINQLEDKLSKI
ncbi:PrgI family protein [Candidatus Gracilibacteria bacterium 28_42_T64]|nr:PrgI family protein [Candidatus Gracilibacteria bacterium 28_42_T64]